jgi:hypothetical protein
MQGFAWPRERQIKYFNSDQCGDARLVAVAPSAFVSGQEKLACQTLPPGLTTQPIFGIKIGTSDSCIDIANMTLASACTVFELSPGASVPNASFFNSDQCGDARLLASLALVRSPTGEKLSANEVRSKCDAATKAMPGPVFGIRENGGACQDISNQVSISSTCNALIIQ